MTEPTKEEIDEYFWRVANVFNAAPGNLIAAVLSNLIAATAIETMKHGNEPYSVARRIYQNAKVHIKANLDAQGVTTKRPKGMH